MTPANCHSVPDDDPQARELGERLGAWLEQLGLVDHLGEAGLPTFRRDENGAATWTDPNTGARLTLDQLRQLDDLLHREGEEPAHAVPVPLLLLARQARLRAELLASPWHDYESLAELRDASVNATRFAVHKAAAEHRLLAVAADERTIVPAFQLTARGELRAELAPLLEPLLAAGMDAWRVWAWLTQPAALLGGEVPERAAVDDAELARRAAALLAERARQG